MSPTGPSPGDPFRQFATHDKNRSHSTETFLTWRIETVGHRILAAFIVAALLLISTDGRLLALPKVRPRPRLQFHEAPPAVQPPVQVKPNFAPQRTAPELKNHFTSQASKVQRHLLDDPRWHNAQPQSPWQWGLYEYLPTGPQTTVVRVENGNTLTVAKTVQLNQAIGPVGRRGRFLPRRVFGFAPAPSVPIPSPTVAVGNTIQVRLAGVAAPMTGHALFDQSTQNLSKLANGQSVRLVPVGLDPDGVVVAQVFLANTAVYLNEQQIRDGMARNSVEDGLDVSLAGAEEQAQLAGAGLWNPKAAATP
jgi:endonuclease YncB( thermonuclease family)